MKSFVVLSVLFLVNLALALPASRFHGSEHRWELTPDGNGKLHLIDLNTFDASVEPAFIPEEDMTFTLFTRSNPTVGQRINVGDLASVQNSNFNGAHPTRVMIHGWQSSGTDGFNTGLAAEYLRNGDFNVIAVDWSVGAGTINYIASRNRVGPVGVRTAQLVDFLHLHGFVQFATLHFIGISLGGHAVGHAGKALTRGRVQVIHSLDPAGPLFSLDEPANRVDSGDGVYVETIITNGGGLGLMGAVGHANFFPNFGREQPGCPDANCHHVRSVWLHIESINTVFTGHQCASFAEISAGSCTRTGVSGRMGGPIGSVNLRGNFFLETNAALPFSRG